MKTQTPTPSTKRGRKPDPNKKVQKNVALPPYVWALVEQWADDCDYTEKDGERQWNAAPALERALETVGAFFPRGPMLRERDEKGRFTPTMTPAQRKRAEANQ